MSVEQKWGIAPEECLSLPPDCQEGVENILTFLQQMAEKNLLIPIVTLDKINLPQVQETSKILMNILELLRKQSMPSPLDAAGAEALEATTREIAQLGSRELAWCAAFWAAFRIVVKAGRAYEAPGVASNAGRAAAWETIKDQPKFGVNPFLSLLELYKLGAWKVSFNQGRLTVDFAIIEKGERRVACWKFGDPEILYSHGRGEDCSQAQPLNPKETIG